MQRVKKCCVTLRCKVQVQLAVGYSWNVYHIYPLIMRLLRHSLNTLQCVTKTMCNACVKINLRDNNQTPVSGNCIGFDGYHICGYKQQVRLLRYTASECYYYHQHKRYFSKLNVSRCSILGVEPRFGVDIQVPFAT